MTAAFPHRYQTSLVGDGQGARLIAPSRPDIVGGAPSQFDGRDDWWSPEGLLLAAVTLCVQTTFAALARRQDLSFATWTAHAEGTVDKTATGLAFTAIHVEAEVDVAAADLARAEQLAAKVKRHCLISNSLATPTTLTIRVKAR